MHIADVEKWLKRRPFDPFVLHLSTGERIKVKHPETCFPGRMALHVVFLKDGRFEGFANVSVLHVVKIEPLNGSGGSHRRNGQKK